MKKLIVVVGILLLLIVPTVEAQDSPDSPDPPAVAACAAAYILPLLAIGFVTVKEVPPLATQINPCAIWMAVLVVVVGIGLLIAGIEKRPNEPVR